MIANRECPSEKAAIRKAPREAVRAIWCGNRGRASNAEGRDAAEGVSTGIGER